MTGSGVVTVFVYKGLTRYSKIGNTPVGVLTNSVDWNESGVPNLVRVSNKTLQNTAK